MAALTKLSLAVVGAAFITLGTVGKVQAVTFIDTCGAECGINGAIGPLGEGNPPQYINTIGQTFTVPDTDNVLTEFSFFVSDTPSGTFGVPEVDVVDFRAFVIGWDETNRRPTGSVVFESTPRSTTIQNSIYPMPEYRFSTGVISLTSGTKYLAFLSSVKDFDGLTGLAWVGESPTFSPFDRYPGGEVWTITATDFDSLTSRSWSPDDYRLDLNFKATFVSETRNSVSEPASALGVLALGAFGTGLLHKRKQDK